ncbi:MFS transporter [Solicola sp. PLA-1-18]|uniref:MFS transporter n=1 Tax=Solicola sp. PLA-1-18 TaxID=3380532 RepID=UPI003B7654FC
MTATTAPAHPRTTLAVCCSALFLSSLDTAALVVALPSLQEDLGLSVAQLQWVVVASALARGSLLFWAGTMADRHGAKRVLCWGVAIFATASIACAFAPSAIPLIGLRLMQGLGGALMTPGSIALLSASFTDPRERGRALGSWSATAGISSAIGPLVGGILITVTDWRAVFLIAAPFAATVLLASRRVAEAPRATRVRRADLAGQVVVAAAMLTVTLGLSGAARVGWTSPQTWGPLLVAATATALLWRVENAADDPVIDPDNLRSPLLRGAMTTAGFSYLCLTGVMFVNTLFLQQVRGLSAIAAGALVLPLTLATLVAAKVAGAWMGSRGPRPPVLLAHTCLTTALLVLALTTSADGPVAPMLLGYALLGTGMGLANPPSTAAAIASLPDDRAGAASAVTSVSRQIGMNLGTALVGSLAVSFAALATTGPPSGATVAGAIDPDAYVTGMRLTYLLLGVLALVCLATAHRLVRPVPHPDPPPTAPPTGTATAAPTHPEGETMTTQTPTTGRTKVTSVRTGAIFTLPYLVGLEKGYFADEGIDLELVAPGAYNASVAPIEDHTLVSSFGGLSRGFEEGSVSFYRACEWGQVRRSHDSERGGQIVSKRAAIASQAIFVRPDSPVLHPQALADRTVAVNFHHGSHYLAIQTLEGFVDPEHLKVVHVGGPADRYRALRDGTVDAVALMEPYISLALSQGYRLVAESFYTGAEIAGEDVDADTFAAIDRAVKRAVADINTDVTPYLHYFTEEVPDDLGELQESQISPWRLRFADPEPYPPHEFDQTYRWLVKWGLVDDGSDFDTLVANRVTSPA